MVPPLKVPNFSPSLTGILRTVTSFREFVKVASDSVVVDNDSLIVEPKTDIQSKG